MCGRWPLELPGAPPQPNHERIISHISSHAQKHEYVIFIHFIFEGSGGLSLKKNSHQIVSITTKYILISLNRIKLTPSLSLYVYWLRKYNKVSGIHWGSEEGGGGLL